MTAGPVIRQARHGDAPAIAHCTRAAYQTYVQRLGYEPKPMVTDHGDWIASDQVWVLLEDTILMGVLVITPEETDLLIYSIAVHPEVQGCGHGRRLMSFAEQYAVDQGFDSIVLYTNEKMTENISFYGGLGFVETDRRPHPIRANSWLVHMKKMITPVQG